MNIVLGKEVEITIGGKAYTLARLDRRIADQFLAYVIKKRPDPLDAIKAKLEGFPEHLQKHMVDVAMKKADEEIGYTSPEFNNALATPAGSYHLLYLMLHEAHPELTKDAVIALYDACVEEHGMGYLEDCIKKSQGEVPKDKAKIKEDTLVEFGLLEPKKKVGRHQRKR